MSMRLGRRIEAEPAPVRARRQRYARRRFILAGVVAGIGGIAAASGWYLERNGMIATMMAPIEARIATQAAALHLTVQSVEVEGRRRAERQAILDALRVSRGTPIFGIDLDAARTRLETIPWVRAAAVERRLPDTIYIRLVESEPAAIWQHHKRFDLIDQNGAVIPGARVEEFPTLLQVIGDGAPQAASDLLDMLASEPAIADRVNAAIRLGNRRWNLKLDNGIEIALPEDSPDAAWHRLAALDRSDHLLERELLLVDLRLQDRLVLRLSPETAKSLIKKTRSPRPDA